MSAIDQKVTSADKNGCMTEVGREAQISYLRRTHGIYNALGIKKNVDILENRRALSVLHGKRRRFVRFLLFPFSRSSSVTINAPMRLTW